MSYLKLAKQAAARRRAQGSDDADGSQAPSPPSEVVADALPFLSMRLDEFALRGTPLEVRVSWLPVTLWFVPTDRNIPELLETGVSRGRIWTAAELLALMAVADRTPETAKTITHAKLAFDGGITEARPREDDHDVEAGAT